MPIPSRETEPFQTGDRVETIDGPGVVTENGMYLDPAQWSFSYESRDVVAEVRLDSTGEVREYNLDQIDMLGKVPRETQRRIADERYREWLSKQPDPDY